MTNQMKSGRAQVRDKSPAQGIYEVDYMLHTNVRLTKKINAPDLTQKVITASIRSVSGHILKNGIYDLEENGATIHQLQKTGTDWRVIS